jgi:signal transduction histidine kinase/ActR/RegA family two-component response regulator
MTRPSPGNPPTSSDAVARTECIGFVLEQGITGSIAVAVIALLYAMASWNVIDRTWIVGWLLAVNVVGFGRVALYLLWNRRASMAVSDAVWARVCVAAGLLSGACWGFAATALFPAGHPELYLIVCLILIGMPAGALSSFAPWFPAYAAYVLASVWPFAISNFLAQDGHSWLGGVGAVVFGGFLLREAWATSAALRRNVVQRIEMEALSHSLAEARDAAEAASRAKSTFLANISHELRTPLTAVIGMNDLIVRNEEPAQAQRYATIAAQSARSLLNLINGVLDLSRIEAGRLELQAEPVRPRALAGEVEAMFRPEADRKGIALHFAIADAIPALVRTDPLRLRQVLVNLVGNALKFTEVGSVTVSADARMQPDGRTFLRVEVRDTGIGISPSGQGRLFRPFSQVHDRGDRRYGGSGLGLGISREIVTAMGGEIGLQSAPGQGSVFWFELPIEALPDAVVHAGKAPTTDLRVAARSRPMHVLVVDDNPVNLMLASRLLTTLGCRLANAASGSEALEQLEAARFDLVFMDSQMPGMDGITATRLWREREQASGSHVPIVALTASAMDGDREKFLAAGMDDYVSKPFAIDDLRQVLQRFGAPSLAGDVDDGGSPSAGRVAGLSFDPSIHELGVHP